MNRKFAFPLLALTLAGITMAGVLGAQAQDASSPYQSLVQRIAQRFNLNESDVQAVFDEVKDERHAEMRTRFEERLTQAVNDGKLTENQKQLILAKMQELHSQHEANREEFRNMTPEERREAMQTKRAELEKWAQDNGIDLQYLFGTFHGGMHGGFHISS